MYLLHKRSGLVLKFAIWRPVKGRSFGPRPCLRNEWLLYFVLVLCLSGRENGAIKTKAFVIGLLPPELNIVGGAVSLIHQLPI